jgi:NAD(P)-dependent dehydrogenase (short-subunit alcohol dehydrogenase family)
MLSDSVLSQAANLQGHRVLVTGAAGFIGANLVRLLWGAGCRVHAVIRPGGRPWRLQGLGDGVILHPVDLGDESSLDDLFAPGTA